MRKHRVIRQEIVQPGAAFQFDFETGQFDNIMVSWDNTASAADIGFIQFCPTINRSPPLNGPIFVAPNFPGLPVVAGSVGKVLYAAIGVGCLLPFPLPDMLTVGVSSVGVVTLRIEGDEHENLLQDPNPGDLEKNRA